MKDLKLAQIKQYPRRCQKRYSIRYQKQHSMNTNINLASLRRLSNQSENDIINMNLRLFFYLLLNK